METHFAPAEKATDDDLTRKIEIVSRNPLVSGLLHSISGLIAVLDEHRQIVALNDSFLNMLGISNPGGALGLRPGEALHCVHADGEPAGCGTTKYCATCGAAIAIVSSLGQDKPAERICALTADRGGHTVDIALLVKSHPLRIDDQKFLLLFLRDITRQEQQAALERTFFHDINNLLSILLLSSELLVHKHPSELADTIRQMTMRMHKEIAMQRSLSTRETGDYQPAWQAVTPKNVMAELRTFFDRHPVAEHKSMAFPDTLPDVTINTDISLLLRVLNNMVINAFEATGENGTVRVWAEEDGNRLSFCVWNARVIAPEVRERVFQRNFSTKEQAGRGIGTFSMKYFGEKILGGTVDFSSSRQDGTVFSISLPR